jgi:hypothetical protein
MVSMNKVVGQSGTLEEDARPVVAELKLAASIGSP